MLLFAWGKGKLVSLVILFLCVVSWGTTIAKANQTKYWFSKSNERGVYSIPHVKGDLVEIQFDLTPRANYFEGVVGLKESTSTDVQSDELALIIRLSHKGYFMAKNGKKFSAVEYLPYRAKIRYHFRMLIDFHTRRYTVYVQPDGGAPEILLALNYAFNSSADQATYFQQLFLNSQEEAQFQLENLTIGLLNKKGPWTSTADFSGVFEWGQKYREPIVIEYALTPFVDNMHGGVGVVDTSIPISNWRDLAVHLRLNHDGFFDVFNGEMYTAANFIPYQANQTYLIKMIIDLLKRQYSIIVTSETGHTDFLAQNLKFREDAVISTELNGICLKSDLEGTLEVKDLVIYPYSELPTTSPGVVSHELSPLDWPFKKLRKVISVRGYHSEAIQEAVNEAQDGDMVFFPPGDYVITQPISINKSIVLRGGGNLVGIAQVESESAKGSPAWDQPPARFKYGNQVGFNLLEIRGDHVQIENISFQGGVSNPKGWAGEQSRAINAILGKTEIIGCEFFDFQKAIHLEGLNVERELKVQNSYFWRNISREEGYGIYAAPGGRGLIMAQGCEFSENRSGIVNQATNVDIVIEDNYFHHAALDLEGYQVALLAGTGSGGRNIVRNNIFRVWAPILFETGSGEVTGNDFGSTKGQAPVLVGYLGNQLEMLENCSPQNIYVSRNFNQTGLRHLLQVRDYSRIGLSDQSEGRYYLGHNLYEYGELWEGEHDDYPTLVQDVAPKMGEIFVTEPNQAEPLKTIERNQWYDLHLVAVDPQGGEGIEKIGIQIHEEDFPYLPGNQGGVFRASGDYFLEIDGGEVLVRSLEGSSEWQPLTAQEQGENQYVEDLNGDPYRVDSYGNNGRYYRIRFRLLAEALPGQWLVHGYVQDRDGHLPRGKEYLQQIGWRFEVR